MTKIVITGSHPTPAQALIEVLPKDWQVISMGKADSPRFYRFDWFSSLKELIKLPALVAQYKLELKKLRPDAVVSFGGYEAVPICWAAKLSGIPIVIHEQTFSAGLSSKLTAPLAQKIAISWESSRQFFPKRKTVLTGNLIRKSLLNIKKQSNPNVLYIAGGHQGSVAVNEAIAPLLPELVKSFTVFHQLGLNTASGFKDKNYHAQKYFNLQELEKIYSQARLVIGRAGVNTVTELAYLGIPALLIPLPYTQKNEQLLNARFLQRLGLAVILEQKNMTSVSLRSAIDRALQELPRPSTARWPRSQVAQAAGDLMRLIAAVTSGR
jgi:UDP-N-acetylglucosamine--N-acetylmuramyl-(pentapeptide) pyrophosphoryl-undecaprenol N-acetylglucosamine transferase